MRAPTLCRHRHPLHAFTDYNTFIFSLFTVSPYNPHTKIPDSNRLPRGNDPFPKPMRSPPTIMRRNFSTWYSLASLCLTLSATLLLIAFAINRYDCPNTSLEVRYTGILLIPTAYALFAPIFQRTPAAQPGLFSLVELASHPCSRGPFQFHCGTTGVACPGSTALGNAPMEGPIQRSPRPLTIFQQTS